LLDNLFECKFKGIRSRSVMIIAEQKISVSRLGRPQPQGLV